MEREKEMKKTMADEYYYEPWHPSMDKPKTKEEIAKRKKELAEQWKRMEKLYRSK